MTSYDVIRVTRGEYLGNIGYLDYETSGYAVVYFGEPFVSDPDCIPLTDVEAADVPHLPTERWIRDNPDLAEEFEIS